MPMQTKKAQLSYQQQADATLSQANPVSTTLYTVLATTTNVRLLSFVANITWAVTQPTPLEVVVTIDGNTLIFTKNNPVSATQYYNNPYSANDEASQGLDTNDFLPQRPFALEGKSVRVQIRVTWAVTQPSPLICRVKYARLV